MPQAYTAVVQGTKRRGKLQRNFRCLDQRCRNSLGLRSSLCEHSRSRLLLFYVIAILLQHSITESYSYSLYCITHCILVLLFWCSFAADFKLEFSYRVLLDL